MASPVVISGERVEVSLAGSCELGEGALWSQRHAAYLTVDIYGPSAFGSEPAVHVHDPYTAGATLKRFPMPSFTGTVVPRQGAGFLVALADGVYAVNEDGELTFLCNP